MAQIISRRGRWRPAAPCATLGGHFSPEERPWHPTPRRSGFPAHPAPCFPRDWTRPAEPPLAYALFAHCFTCSKESKAATLISASLAERGVAVLRFDFTGLGGSEGEFANTNFSSNVGDLVAAAGHLRKHYRAPAILIGHSLGGTAVLPPRRTFPNAPPWPRSARLSIPGTCSA